MTHTPVLIVGAGPFGLSLAAQLQYLDIEHLILGKPMYFWQAHMPQDMLLRSAYDWHLDPQNVATIEAYLQTLDLEPADVEPLSLERYLDYTRWFQEQKQFNILPQYVRQIDEKDGHFTAMLENGQTVTADNVVLALGFQSFSHTPANLAAMLPEGRYGHTCELVDLAPYAGRRVLIIGGRQSAFEWTALLHEAGAAAVHVSYRHDTPQFTTANWSWFNQQVDEIVNNPAWFRNLSAEEQAAVNERFWEEGRLKLEPWLAPRIDHESITLWPHTEMSGCTVDVNGALQITLSSGDTIVADDVIFATGYKVDMSRVELLDKGNMFSRLATRGGYPQLDVSFQTNIPGLYVTSMPAVQDFGLFFAFTISVRTSALIIGRALYNKMA